MNKHQGETSYVATLALSGKVCMCVIITCSSTCIVCASFSNSHLIAGFAIFHNKQELPINILQVKIVSKT